MAEKKNNQKTGKKTVRPMQRPKDLKPSKDPKAGRKTWLQVTVKSN